MDKVNLVVTKAFREITEKGIYDVKKGNAPMPKVSKMEMNLIPNELTNYVNDFGYGCCFVFSSYMLNILNRYDINAYLIASVEYYGEQKGIRASVLYENNGNWFVANPVEDIEYFTEHNIASINRAQYYIGETAKMIIDGKEHDDSNYTLDEFQKKYGKVWLIGSMKNNNTTLNQEMDNIDDKCIAPPEEANLDVKILTK